MAILFEKPVESTQGNTKGEGSMFKRSIFGAALALGLVADPVAAQQQSGLEAVNVSDVSLSWMRSSATITSTCKCPWQQSFRFRSVSLPTSAT
jgi:hypothetical protein